MLSVTTATSEDSYTVDGEKARSGAGAGLGLSARQAHARALDDPVAGISRAYQAWGWKATSARSVPRCRSSPVGPVMARARRPPQRHSRVSPNRDRRRRTSISRQQLRELCWVSTFSANSWPALQAQKSKNRCATACPRACATRYGRCSRTANSVRVLPPARHLFEYPLSPSITDTSIELHAICKLSLTRSSRPGRTEGKLPMDPTACVLVTDCSSLALPRETNLLRYTLR